MVEFDLASHYHVFCTPTNNNYVNVLYNILYQTVYDFRAYIWGMHKVIQ